MSLSSLSSMSDDERPASRPHAVAKPTATEERKRRGCNFTAAEKDILLALVNKYQKILDNKETNATMVAKKREVWDAVCLQYNAVAGSGVRTWQQLRHLYENLKHRSKKSMAKANQLPIYEKEKSICNGSNLVVAAPKITIAPLPNLYDDAALFRDGDPSNVIKIEASPDIILDEADNHDDQDRTIEHSIAEYTKPCTCRANPAGVKPKQKESLREQYFRTKLRNIKLQNKFIINKNRMDLNKYKVEIQILKLRLKKMQSSR